MTSTAIEEMAREQAKKDLKIIEFNFAALRNFIDEWNNCAQRMIEKYGNRMTLEEAEQQGVIANDSRRNQKISRA